MNESRFNLIEYTRASHLLSAMMTRTEVRSTSGIIGIVDELYRSVWGNGLRVRLCDKDGRVHHFGVHEVVA